MYLYFIGSCKETEEKIENIVIIVDFKDFYREIFVLQIINGAK